MRLTLDGRLTLSLLVGLSLVFSAIIYFLILPILTFSFFLLPHPPTATRFLTSCYLFSNLLENIGEANCSHSWALSVITLKPAARSSQLWLNASHCFLSAALQHLCAQTFWASLFDFKHSVIHPPQSLTRHETQSLSLSCRHHKPCCWPLIWWLEN